MKQSLCFDNIIVSTQLMYLLLWSVGQNPAASTATSRGFTASVAALCVSFHISELGYGGRTGFACI